MSADQIALIDNWRKANDVTRSEAIRRLVEIGLGKPIPPRVRKTA